MKKNAYENAEKRISVMEIERFAIKDGPGIRSTVFLEGCPLHCPWCANPESQEIGKKLLYAADRCCGCGTCAAVCPFSAVKMNESGKPEFNRDVCRKCGQCVAHCPNGAITFSGKIMTAGEILDIVLRDKEYYKNSGGGITFSGGEPFFQYEGLAAMLALSKASYLHTAVETCGNVPTQYIHEQIDNIDLFLFDVKHSDPCEFHEITGGNLDLILNNLHYIAAHTGSDVLVRIPVIPGYNDTQKIIGDIFRIVQDCGIKTVQLLPYHALGVNKYKRLGRPYLLEGVKSLQKNDLKAFANMGTEAGLQIITG